jgi:zinc protease
MGGPPVRSRSPRCTLGAASLALILLAPPDQLSAQGASDATSAHAGVPAVAHPGEFAARLARVVHDTTLANGLEVISVENHSVPLVTLMVVVHTGAFTQESGQVGVPHLFEHMLFKSYNANGRTWDEAMHPLDIAGDNGETGDESVRYYIVLPSDKADDGLAALAELVRDPSFSKDDLNRERQVVFDEINRDNSEPEHWLSDEVEQRLWTTAWDRKNALGDATLAAVNTGLLDRVFHRYYVPNNAALIISGDVGTDQAFKLANKRFGHWKREPDPFAGFSAVTPPPVTHSHAIINEHDVTDVLVHIEWQGPSTSIDAPSTYAADVLSSILNASGGTFQEHLVDSGLFTSCSISYLTREHVGPITLTAHLSVDSVPRALAALTAELQHLDTPKAFTDEELDDARQTRPVETALLLEHRTDIAGEIADFWSSAGFSYFVSYADELNAVTRPQIDTYVRRYLHAPMVVGLLAPRNAGTALRPALAAFLNAPVSSSVAPAPSAAQ